MNFKPELWQIPPIPEAVYVELDNKIATLKERLYEIVAQHDVVRFASSLAIEDMLITDVIAQIEVPVEVFTLDTLMLNPETLALIDTVKRRYPDIAFTVYQPQAEAVKQYETEKGKHAFYESVELRKTCCGIRKIEPLNRALVGADAWLTGQRREQSVTRTELEFAEQDSARGIAKYNPIFDWTELDVWAYMLHFDIPYNQLYLQGYPSIGCEPCTRPVKLGEDIRAGRWWWENKDSKECGLHSN